MEGSFGNIELKNNTESTYNGSGNSGLVEDCVNLNLSVTNSELNIKQSKDMHITASNSKFVCRKTTTSTISGSDNTIDTDKVNNAKIEGNGNQIFAQSSTDLDFVSDKSKVSVTDVNTCKLAIKSMDVTLQDCYNVCVTGDSGNVFIWNASNQTVHRMASVNGRFLNLITFAKPEGNNAEGQAPMNAPGNIKNLSVTTTFDIGMNITNQTNYSLDGVSFSIFPKHVHSDIYMVSISDGLDFLTIKKNVLGPTIVEIIGRNPYSGKTHVLCFRAPHIMQDLTKNDLGFSFCLSGCHTSRL